MSDIASRRSRVSGGVMLIALMAFSLLPLFSMLATALLHEGSFPTGFQWPTHPQWGNFASAWKTAQFLQLFESSLAIVLGAVPAAVFLATLAGFALAQPGVPGGKYINLTFIVGLTLPTEALITPLYYEAVKFGVVDTRWAVVLPLIGLYMPFGVYWMRQQFLGIPAELTEAAEMDGASTWRVFWSVHLPLSRAALSALCILFFLWTWNQFLLPLVMERNPLQRTMAGGLGAFQGQYGSDIILLCADVS